MKKMFLSLVAVTFALTGCVSNKAYKASLDEAEGRRVQLENAKQELDETKQALEASKKETESAKKEMEDLKSAHEKEMSALNAQLQDLSRGSQEIAVLRKELEYLKRENDRLQVKTGELSQEKEKELAKVKNTYESLVKEMQKEIEQGDIKITQAMDRLSVNLVEKILFDSGKAEVKPEGLKILKRVGDILMNVADKQIRIEGHTDNVKISSRLKDKYPSNWELSTARATNVVRYLQEKVGIDPKLLSSAGLSEYKPVASNDTDEGRAQNRRIEIVLLPLDVDSVLEELKK